MESIQSILLGIVQGLTEFLPVSSSGHLVLAQAMLGTTPGGGIMFEVAVHLATLAAILLFYRQRVTVLIVGGISGEKDAWRYILKLALATLPAVAVALLARDWVERQFESLTVVAVCLIITGFVIWSTRFTHGIGTRREPGWLAALTIGCVQAAAILPGISRSGSTVAIGLALGLAYLAAAEFSFLLGAIAMAGAGILLIPELSSISAADLNAILLGGSAALVSGLLALWSFVWLLKNQRLYLFAIYVWIVGGLTLALG